MQQIIKDNRIQEDNRILVGWPDVVQTEGSLKAEYVADNAAFQPMPGNRYILPVDYWLTSAPEFSEYSEVPGVWISGSADLEALHEVFILASLIAIEFGSFVDGSGFSTASLIREEFNFQGELRAFGSVLPDQVAYLLRCGFSSVAFSQTEDLEQAAQQLQLSDCSYQGSVAQPRTPFLQRMNKSRRG
ncbi:DUF934 domain-containing protein [Amphritea balenae]|uniref:DUF934 domain-containing protein n=1 Tax=Amphritea balenae TaxID=452629 RepID=A0A3P1SSZ0_9GAMM|nr:DUF934 domain-containing protein [Amphritea balenae]RRD00005.1 DUF934 domain-containing protein [Amphritea balenae]GGK75808.1 hypothetical protein GCM10007941_27440 [Amphritea balenae]